MFTFTRLLAVTWLAVGVSVTARPIQDSVDSSAMAKTRASQKRALDMTFKLPSPSRVCAAGADEGDPNRTVFVAPEDDQEESAIWERLEGELPFEEVYALEEWLAQAPDNHISYLQQGQYENRWRRPGGGIEFVIAADRRLPIEATQLVIGNWVNVLGHHREVNGVAPAGMLTLVQGNIHIMLRPVPDRVDRAIQPQHLIVDADSDDDLEGVEIDPMELERLAQINGTGMPIDEIAFAPNETPMDYWDELGQIGGMPTYGSRSRRRRRTFGLIKKIWETLFGHTKPPPTEPPPPYTAICGCQRVMKVVDLGAEVQRLQLSDLDLMPYASDDPREHDRMDEYLARLQNVTDSATSEDKARAIASLLRLNDDPPSYMVTELEEEIKACGTGAKLVKRKPPKGLASERWEDDRWNHQLSQNDVRELMNDLQRNGLARVKADFQSFRVGNAYVSWSSKFSDDHFAPPSREEILPFVRMFLKRVSWGENEGGQWWKPWKPNYWSTSYRDIVFGQKTMRLCISNRPKRCLK